MSGVAPTSTNLPTVNYNYGWNGSSWDQLSGLITGGSGTPSVQVVTIQGIAGGTPAPVIINGYSYKHIAAGTATTVVKASAGFLHSITFNGQATATNVTTIYDNPSTSGTVIGIPLATAIVSPVTIIYDVAFTSGLTIITTTANSADMTVSWQ